MRPIVTDRVAWSVLCRSVCHTSEPYKNAAPIEMLFGLRTPVDPRNHVLDGGPDPPPTGRSNFDGKWRPVVKYRDTLRSSVQKRLNRSISIWAVDLGGQKEAQVQSYLPGGANVPSWEWAILRRGSGVPL